MGREPVQGAQILGKGTRNRGTVRIIATGKYSRRGVETGALLVEGSPFDPSP